MQRHLRAVFPTLALIVFGCSLQHPVADFTLDAGDGAADDGLHGADASIVTDSGAPTDIPPGMDAVEDTIGSDSGVSDEGTDNGPADATADVFSLDTVTDAVTDVLAMDAVTDAGTDVLAMDAVTDTGMDAVADLPLPTDAGSDAGARDAAATADVEEDMPEDVPVDAPPPASCDLFSPCSSGYLCDAVSNGHCHPCGAAGIQCCAFWACDHGLRCHLIDGTCH